MTSDPNSAAERRLAEHLATTTDIGVTDCYTAVYTIMRYLREHPEHGPWPVMTWQEWMWAPLESTKAKVPVVVVPTPDPDPPAAEVPSVDDAIGEIIHLALNQRALDALAKKDELVARLVEAANGGGAK